MECGWWLRRDLLNGWLRRRAVKIQELQRSRRDFRY